MFRIQTSVVPENLLDIVRNKRINVSKYNTLIKGHYNTLRCRLEVFDRSSDAVRQV